MAKQDLLGLCLNNRFAKYRKYIEWKAGVRELKPTAEDQTPPKELKDIIDNFGKDSKKATKKDTKKDDNKKQSSSKTSSKTSIKDKNKD